MKKILSLMLTVALLLALTVPSFAAAETELGTAVEKSAAYMLRTVKKPAVASVGGEWAVLGLARSGHAVPQEYWDSYYAVVEKTVSDCKGVLHDKKYTEYSRVVVALTAIGADPTNVAGYNLLTPLGDFDKTVWQGINGPIWALTALDAGNYDMPVNTNAATQATRQMYVDELLARQLDNGGWNLTDEGGSGSADADITGMALQALAKYRDQAEVKTAAEKALTYLSTMQDAGGGFSSYGVTNCESIVQVVVALCELGISLEDPRFVKNEKTLLDALFAYQVGDGSFRHKPDDTAADQMATEQSFYALVAAKRQLEGKSSLYRMNDVTVSVGGKAFGAVGLSGKHAHVQKVPVSAPGTSFSDVEGHANQSAVESLASRGIINGMGDGSFAPDATMTRAQFAAVVVRGLGLEQKTVSQFADVRGGDWFAAFVGAAYSYGIVSGRSETVFDPNGIITRQEAAAMVTRAAKLCGMDTELEDHEILNMLAQFGDYVTIAPWGRESMAFCYGENILDQSDWNTEPTRAILRCEIAQMLYNMLDKAKLL